MEILKGLPVANSINEQLIEDIKNIDGELPHLAIIRVGERPDDCSYERGAVKKMDKVGVRCTTYTFAADISNDEFQKEFDRINNNPDIDGILLLRPLPKHIDEKAVENRIDPRKDLDGISPVNLAKVYAGDETGYAPCTAEAVIEMLDYAGVDIKGRRVTVVGRSLVIGKPVAMLLMKRNATVTVVHTKTVDMAATCKHAEIVRGLEDDGAVIGKDPGQQIAVEEVEIKHEHADAQRRDDAVAQGFFGPIRLGRAGILRDEGGDGLRKG